MKVWKEFLRLKAIEIGNVLLKILGVFIGMIIFLALLAGLGYLISLTSESLPYALMDGGDSFWYGCLCVGFFSFFVMFVTTGIGFLIIHIIPEWLKSNWRQAKRNCETDN